MLWVICTYIGDAAAEVSFQQWRNWKSSTHSLAVFYTVFNIFKNTYLCEFWNSAYIYIVGLYNVRRRLLQRKQQAFSCISRKQNPTENKLAHWYTKALTKSFSRKDLVGNQKRSWTTQRAASNHLYIFTCGILIYSMVKNLRRYQLFFSIFSCYTLFFYLLIFLCVLMFLNVGLFQLLLIDSVGILVVSVMLKCGSWSCSTTFYRKGWVYD